MRISGSVMIEVFILIQQLARMSHSSYGRNKLRPLKRLGAGKGRNKLRPYAG